MNKYEQSYQNPITGLDEEWNDYGNGDPFVLRYNGQYYLYVSTKDHRVGIKAWRSDDLINWNYIGLVADDQESTGAYAPEVTYWNGKFYLYTSPAGQGHYVYESTNPDGPFQRITSNVGLTIDGSVFIDDDYRWYFTHAGVDGIGGLEMSSPSEFGVSQPIQGAYMGHWTEGSMIIKRNGLYYMTLTGNHVFSKGYRINYGVATESPLGPYTMPEHNPIAISTTEDFYGIGHSSTVLGPDMDSYYLVYHNLLGHSSEGPPVRAMNIDRLIFNGTKMDLNGPSTKNQPVPELPDVFEHLNVNIDYSQWNETKTDNSYHIVSKLNTKKYYTAEFNFNIAETDHSDGQFSILYNFTDESNYDRLVISPNTRNVTIESISNSNTTNIITQNLYEDIDLTALHTVRIVHSEQDVQLYWDNLLLAELSHSSNTNGGSVGYYYSNINATLYYTGYANKAGGSSDYDILKIIPGTVEAIHYLSAELNGFSAKNNNKNVSAIRQDDGMSISETLQGEYALQLSKGKEWTKYAVNVLETANYQLSTTLQLPTEDATLEITLDDKTFTYHLNATLLQNLYQTKINSSDSNNASYYRIPIGTLALEEGYQTIKVAVTKGNLAFTNMQFDLVDLTSIESPDILEDSTSDLINGDWTLQDSYYYANQVTQDAKFYGGQTNWSNYKIKTSVIIGEEASGNAGVLLRVQNESAFPDQVIDSYSGYYVAISPTKLEFYRNNYDSQYIEAIRHNLPTNTPIPIVIDAIGAQIIVKINDQVLLDYIDPNPWLVGKVGIRSNYSKDIKFSGLQISN